MPKEVPVPVTLLEEPVSLLPLMAVGAAPPPRQMVLASEMPRRPTG